MTMAELTVRKSVTVDIPIHKAFTVFTGGFDSWWPRSHKIGAAELREAVLEGRQGGRWYEIDVDGSECEWGRVLQVGSTQPAGARLADRRHVAVRP